MANLNPESNEAQSQDNVTKDLQNLSYEEARAELIETARQLESRDIELEAALKLWERGQELAKVCENILRDAQNRVQKAQDEAAKAE
ncbi:exodeoxyribonuclease VII small subunit [Boudabousia liubingyangii]|uniref:Exodeoxyribonuclease 7 small subunit n=1 Tax=Boudabousia liubingyangii TaxID=1921764 RepID=A0A1Q5PJU7_9ACTO|nr:exodeoxyribonuclease VII small subunit [Boudabousia liubingyangii]OKL46206.1 exodeoxyribonuclease VII small subunit [Boudabousia liubingyangii]